MRPGLAWAVLMAALIWAAAIVSAPRVLSAPRVSASGGPPSSPPADAGAGGLRTAAAIVYVGASAICHQRPERSFWIGDRPMPVCARCTGLYLGAPIGLALVLLRRRSIDARLPPDAAPRVATPLAAPSDAAPREMASTDRAYSWWRTALILACVPTAASLGLEWTVGVSNNVSRALTALPLGAAVAALVGAALAGAALTGPALASVTLQIGMNHTRATTADEPRVMDRGRLLLLCFVAWVIPGAGHLWQRQMTKGLVFLAILPLMFGLGLLLDGTLFSLAPTSQSLLTTGAALAERGVGLPWMVTALLGRGAGDVVSPTYEYGWVFMVVAGLLNCLVILDARDIALGRKDVG